MIAVRDDRHPVSALETLAKALESMEIGPGAGELAADRDRIVSTLRSYLIPRFEDPRGPLIVVFAGPTGSGKSTLVNSLTGRDISRTGSLRPTTSTPLVVASMPHAPRFQALAGVDCEVVAGSAPILSEMILVDTPDIDSTAVDHRLKAEALIDRADVVVFVTSALRYADDVAWQVLRRAVSRGADMIHVLNRASSSTSGAASDLRSRLREQGLDTELLTIPEHHVPIGGQRIPSLAVRALRRRLAGIAASRDTAARSTRDRVLAVALRQTRDLVLAATLTSEDVDALAAELSVDLAKRSATLDLANLPSLGAIPPVPAGRLARSRWRRALRADSGDLRGLERRLVDEIGAVIHGDLRSWVEEERHRFGVAHLNGRLASSAAPAVTASLEGWISFVRTTAAHHHRDVRLVERVLFEAALDGGERIATEALGEGWREIVDRARRDLTARIGIVYQHFGSLVLDLIRADVGDLGAAEARAALGVLLAPAPLVDA